MIPNKLLARFVKRHKICTVRNLSSQVNIEKLEQESTLSSSDFVSDEAKLREETIEQSRNKSRLREQDRDILKNKHPYSEPKFFHHGTLKYLRRAYGRYGEASGVNPSICWPIKQELENSKDYENVKYPFTIPEMMAEAAKLRKEKEERIMVRQQDIVKKMQKLEEWKQDLFTRIAKKEAEAKAAKGRKERLVEEVRRHFGYSLDPRDDKFKEMLEKKEKEQRKALKEEKRKQKEAKSLERLAKKKEAGKSEDDNESDEISDENKKEKDVPAKEE